MAISAAQCRAARALLDWSQDQLAENAHVARASIADFERNIRTPMRNNMVSIIGAFRAAGIRFIADAADGGAGAGVRFRKVELEFSRNVKVSGDGVMIAVRHVGTQYRILAPGEVIDALGTAEDARVQVVQERLPLFVGAAETEILRGGRDAGDTITLTRASFPAGTF